jgi:hypothetical protein
VIPGVTDTATQVGEQQSTVAPDQREEQVQFAPLSNTAAAEAAFQVGLPDRYVVSQGTDFGF